MASVQQGPDSQDADEDHQVIEWLKPVFPQLTPQILRASVLHPSNRQGQYDKARLLQRCIDDLLELRTYRMACVPEFNESSVYETSDGENSFHEDSNTSVSQAIGGAGTQSQPISIGSEDDTSRLPDLVAENQGTDDVRIIQQKTKDQILLNQIEEVCGFFPDIKRIYVENYLRSCKSSNPVQAMVEFLFDRKGLYPKQKNTDVNHSPISSKTRKSEKERKDELVPSSSSELHMRPTGENDIALHEENSSDITAVPYNEETSKIQVAKPKKVSGPLHVDIVQNKDNDLIVAKSVNETALTYVVQPVATSISTDLNGSKCDNTAPVVADNSESENNLFCSSFAMDNGDSIGFKEDNTKKHYKISAVQNISDNSNKDSPRLSNETKVKDNLFSLKIKFNLSRSHSQTSVAVKESVSNKSLKRRKSSDSKLVFHTQSNDIYSEAQMAKMKEKSSYNTYKKGLGTVVKRRNSDKGNKISKDASSSNSVPTLTKISLENNSQLANSLQSKSLQNNGFSNSRSSAAVGSVSALEFPNKTNDPTFFDTPKPENIETSEVLYAKTVPISDGIAAKEVPDTTNVPIPDKIITTKGLNAERILTVEGPNAINRPDNITKLTQGLNTTSLKIPEDIAVMQGSAVPNPENTVKTDGLYNKIAPIPENIVVAEGPHATNTLIPKKIGGLKETSGSISDNIVATEGPIPTNGSIIDLLNTTFVQIPENVASANDLNATPVIVPINIVPIEMEQEPMDVQLNNIDIAEQMRIYESIQKEKEQERVDPIQTPFIEETFPEVEHQKSPTEIMADEVCLMFPNVDPNYVEEKLKTCQCNDKIACVVNKILGLKSYPKKSQDINPQGEADGTTSPKEEPNNNKKKMTEQNIDYYKDYQTPVSSNYYNQCLKLLEMEFRKLPMRDLRYLLGKFNNHYAPTRRQIIETFREFGIKTDEIPLHDSLKSPPPGATSSKAESAVIVTFKLDGVFYKSKLLKCGRAKRLQTFEKDPELVKEIEFIINTTKIEKEEKDRLVAMTVNETEYQEAGQAIECGCCYGEYPFESMVQCYEGHLFCRECLQGYAKEAVFGGGKATLECMSDGCEATYPKSQLMKSLPSTVLAKYEDRCQEEAINLANMEDLVRCPHCDFAALMDPGDKVFKCHNETCLKETCRYCKEDWEEHFGKPCSEIEKKDETKLRLAFEEKMTMAKIRQCHRCKASFTKIDGCNKMTCRCGAKMCYICRKPNIDYNHFCRHVRDPGQPCSTCKACSLWTNPDEDDDRAVSEIKKQAQEERKAQGFEDDKDIGAPDQPGPAPKRQKTSHHHPQHHQRQ